MTLPLELLTPMTLNEVFGVLMSRGHPEAQSYNWPLFMQIPLMNKPFSQDAEVLADFVQEHIDIQELCWIVPRYPDDEEEMFPVKMWCLWWCLKCWVPRDTEAARMAITYLHNPIETNRRAAQKIGNANPAQNPNIAFLAGFDPFPACLIAYPNIVEPILLTGYDGKMRELPHIRLLYCLRHHLPTKYCLD